MPRMSNGSLVGRAGDDTVMKWSSRRTRSRATSARRRCPALEALTVARRGAAGRLNSGSIHAPGGRSAYRRSTEPKRRTAARSELDAHQSSARRRRQFRSASPSVSINWSPTTVQAGRAAYVADRPCCVFWISAGSGRRRSAVPAEWPRRVPPICQGVASVISSLAIAALSARRPPPNGAGRGRGVRRSRHSRQAKSCTQLLRGGM